MYLYYKWEQAQIIKLYHLQFTANQIKTNYTGNLRLYKDSMEGALMNNLISKRQNHSLTLQLGFEM